MLNFKKFGFVLTTLSLFLSINLAACECHDCCHFDKNKPKKTAPRRSIDSYKTIATSRAISGDAHAVELYNGMKFEFLGQGVSCSGARIQVLREIIKSKFSVSLEDDHFVVDFGHAPPTFGDYILLIDGWEYPATRII
jgi:hypothetical protein